MMPGSQPWTRPPAHDMGLLQDQHSLWLVLGEMQVGYGFLTCQAYGAQLPAPTDSATGLQGVREMAASLPAQNLP